MSSLQIRVCGRFKLENKLYEGHFSSVYTGRNVQSDTDCAIKCEPLSNKLNLVNNEGRILEQIQGGIGIPSLLWHGQNGDFNFLITELLGASLEDYFDICGRKFSLKTVLMIGDKILSSIEFVHYKNIVHRDIKPANFVVGLGKKLHQIYTIDYALGAKFSNSKGTHRPDRTNSNHFVGTLKFASLNVLNGHRNSRRDDLESIGLMLIYFLKGKLPWQGLEATSEAEAKHLITEKMVKTSLETLCAGLPRQFQTYMEYVRKLQYSQMPDYNFLKRIFKEKLIREGHQYDHIFDWILIPLKLKDTALSNRIPLNRITKKDQMEPSMANLDSNLKEDYEYWEDVTANQLEVKKEDKPKKQLQSIATQDTRSQDLQQKIKKTSKKSKKDKEDCLVY